MGRKPNVLVFMADQMTPLSLPFYGHKVTRAPHMSEVAAEGVVFDSAYCNSPLCSPSRAAFMSGRLPSKTGAYDNAAEFRSDIPTFAHYLRRVGYRTILSGKMHFCGPDQLHGFEQRLTTDIYPRGFRLDARLGPPARPAGLVSQYELGDGCRALRAHQPDRL